MADINALIAQGGTPVQVENPINAMAKVYALQNAQLQNQLARQQFEQEQGVADYLRAADLTTPEGRAGLRKFGKTGLGYEKLISEQETNALKRKELEGKVRDQQMAALGAGLTSVLADPSDEKLTAAFDRLDATGVNTKPFRDQFAQMPDLEQRKAALTQYLTSNPEGRKALEFVQPKLEKIDLNGKIVFKDMNPNSPTYLKQGEELATTMTPYQKRQLELREREVKVHEQRLAKEGAQLDVSEQAAISKAVIEGKLDPYRITGKNAKSLAQALMADPNANLSVLSGQSRLMTNPTYQQKVMLAEALPEVMSNMVEAGKKLNYSDIKVVGAMEAWRNGQLNDPAMTSYMVQRNDALMSIANVMRGVGMTDQAHRAETEVSSPTMSPKALDAWLEAQNKALAPRLKKMAPLSVTGGGGAGQGAFRNQPAPTKPLPAEGTGAAGGAGAPSIGTVQDGWRFKGGDPADKKNWEKQ